MRHGGRSPGDGGSDCETLQVDVWQKKSANVLFFYAYPSHADERHRVYGGLETWTQRTNLYAFNPSDWEHTQSFVSAELAAISGSQWLRHYSYA